MKKFQAVFAKIVETVFGCGITIVLIAGGLTFFGYLAALVIGGDAAASVCAFISGKINPVLVLISTSLILLGLLKMYVCGETGGFGRKKKDKK